MAAPKDHLTGDAGFPVKTLRAAITIGATGAVGAVSGYGIESVTRNATGDYTLELDTQYAALLFLSGCAENTTAEFINFAIDDADVTASTPVVNFYTIDAAGAAVDPSSGTILHVKVEVQDTKS